MRRRHPALLLLCLLALVGCQSVALAQACAVANPGAATGLDDCHGDPDQDDGHAPCPSVDKAPDWTKLGAFPVLRLGAVYACIDDVAALPAGQGTHTSPRGQAPPLAELCRLLI